MWGDCYEADWAGVAVRGGVFVSVFLGLIKRNVWWQSLVLSVTIATLSVTVLEWPRTQVEVYLDMGIPAGLLLGPRVGLARLFWPLGFSRLT